MKKNIQLLVNGKTQPVEVEPRETLAEVLRDRLGLTGTKLGCQEGDCGSCTVILAGHAVSACLVLAVEAAGKPVVTIEGLEAEGALHPLQRAFMEKGAVQCGFCTPGMVLAAKALLDRNPQPEEAEIREAISGNLCRCTGYQKIVEAVQSVSRQLR